MSRLRILLVLIITIGSSSLRAQDMDYLKHRKVFDICSMKKQCRACYTCEQNRYVVKIRNSSDKQIKNVWYSFYSPVFNKVIEKEAKIQGDKIVAKTTGLVYVCVADGRHWIFSKIVYADESTVNFVLHDRMETYLQEPDECECNDQGIPNR